MTGLERLLKSRMLNGSLPKIEKALIRNQIRAFSCLLLMPGKLVCQAKISRLLRNRLDHKADFAGRCFGSNGVPRTGAQ